MTDLVLDPTTTALVVIDLQNGVVAMPTEPRRPDVVVAHTKQLADALRAKGGFIVWVRVASAPDAKDMLRPLVDVPPPWPASRPANWSEIVLEVVVQPHDYVLTKKQWGAFYGTDLDLQLRRRGIQTIVLTGIATSIGVESTARSAVEHGYQQVFVEDAMASRSAAEHAHTVQLIFPRLGRVRSTQDVLAALA